MGRVLRLTGGGRRRQETCGWTTLRVPVLLTLFCPKSEIPQGVGNVTENYKGNNK